MRNTLFIGGGNMAQAIIGGLLRQGVTAKTLHVIDPNPEAAAKIQMLGVSTSHAWPDDFKPEQVLLAVKPQSMQAVLSTYTAELSDTLLISIAAGVSVAQLQQWGQQPQARVVRCMPNTPALVSQGMTGLFFTNNCTAEDQSTVQALFESCGQVVTLNKEDQINAITAISGSGPGYVFFLMEALEQSAQALGFSPEQAKQLVAQTFLGSAHLASTSTDSFALLREKVTSKGGTTFAGLETLRSQGVDTAITACAQAAYDRALALQNS